MTVQGVGTPTPFGFGGWVAMTQGANGTDVMMGDLVLLQEEVNPVMSALLDKRIDVTALHNHFFWDDPHVYFIHVHGMAKRLTSHIASNRRLLRLCPGRVRRSTPKGWQKSLGIPASKRDRFTRSLSGVTT